MQIAATTTAPVPYVHEMAVKVPAPIADEASIFSMATYAARENQVHFLSRDNTEDGIAHFQFQGAGHAVLGAVNTFHTDLQNILDVVSKHTGAPGTRH